MPKTGVGSGCVLKLLGVRWYTVTEKSRYTSFFENFSRNALIALKFLKFVFQKIRNVSKFLKLKLVRALPRYGRTKK